MRFHKPVGLILLWAPTAWALWIANKGRPPLYLIIYFALGTIIMRAAGCLFNDIADRNIDKHVKRTQERPLASGSIGLTATWVNFVLLMILAFCILTRLPPHCFYCALIAVVITLIYPFCKRFFRAPQFILGLAFSMGIPMAYLASSVAFDLKMLILFILNFFWIIAYDTIYAMADRGEDRRIKINSTAILFSHYNRPIIAVLMCVFHGLWLLIGFMLHASLYFYLFWLFGAGILVYQNTLLKEEQALQNLLRAFSLNALYGLWMSLGLIGL